MNQLPQQNQIVLLAISMSIFGGYKKTTEDDIIKAGGSLPKGELITKGGKHIFPLEKLAPFHANKKQLLREISKFSVKAVGGAMAFNQDDVPEVEALVMAAKDQFAVDFSLFQQEYDQSLAAFISAQSTQGLAEIVRDSALTVAQASERFAFTYDMYVPQPIGAGSTIESMASNLAVRLYEEIGKEAYGLWDKSIMPADSLGVRSLRMIGQKTKRPLVACREKLKKLSFLDGNIQNSIDFIDDVLASTQPQGYLEDVPSNSSVTRFVRLVELMMNAEKFRATSTMTFNDIDAVNKLLGINDTLPIIEAEVVVQTKAEVEVPIFAEDADEMAPEILVIASAVRAKVANNPFENF